MDFNKKQKQLKDFADSLVDLTVDELKAKEQEIIAQIDEANKVCSNTKFDLPAKGYKTTAEAIRSLLDKCSTTWQYTPGLIKMYESWPATKPESVAYPILDQTLRQLGEMQFTGYEEWKKVVAVIEYFEPLRAKFSEVTEAVWDLTAQHNAILDKLKMFEPIATTTVAE